MYSFTVSGRDVQLLRWDRAGAIVSGRFEYVTNQALLLNFFHKLALMSDEEIGWDTTVTNATVEEKGRYKECCSHNTHPDDLVRFEVRPAEGGRRFVIACAQAEFLSRAILGRGTRGHHGVLLGDTPDEDKPIFLKDTWNDIGVDDDAVEPEHEIYEKLKKARVRNILECYGGGDVVHPVEGLPQATLTQEFAKDLVKMHKRVHYRIMLEPVIPLVEFKDPYEVVKVLKDALDCEFLLDTNTCF
jgi:hypothetical protein